MAEVYVDGGKTLRVCHDCDVGYPLINWENARQMYEWERQKRGAKAAPPQSEVKST